MGASPSIAACSVPTASCSCISVAWKSSFICGALRASLAQVRDVLAELESGQRLERDNFADLVCGSDLGLEDLMGKVAERTGTSRRRRLARCG